MELTNLTMLIELARAARDAAATRRTQLQMQREQARAQLDVLRGYMRDYERRAQATLSGGCDMAAQNNLRLFCGKLAQAIDAQQLEVRRREQALAAGDAELLQLQRRLKSLEALQNRQRQAAHRGERRREQKASDELARGALAAERPLAATGW
jgi:flagellar FliJ protein